MLDQIGEVSGVKAVAIVHGALTMLTKMSSRELCLVSRSEMRMPALRRSLSRLVIPVRSPLV